MALIDYLMADYPKINKDDASARRLYRFVGPASTLDPLIPSTFATFQGYQVESTVREVLGLTSYIFVEVVTVEKYATGSTVEQTDNQYPYFEIDQVQVEKSLKQHPDFASFTAADWLAVTTWDAETDTDARAAFQYYERNKDGEAIGSAIALTGTSTSGQIGYATLRLKGVESFLDFAPVVRKTSLYNGNQPPSSADAGQKVSAPSYAPSGYEWLKTADRVSKQGIGKNVWTRQEEWQGARKILLDKDDIF